MVYVGMVVPSSREVMTCGVETDKKVFNHAVPFVTRAVHPNLLWLARCLFKKWCGLPRCLSLRTWLPLSFKIKFTIVTAYFLIKFCLMESPFHSFEVVVCQDIQAKAFNFSQILYYLFVSFVLELGTKLTIFQVNSVLGFEVLNFRN